MSFSLDSIQIATKTDIKQIQKCCNDAFLIDAFFKKPKYHIRFSEDKTDIGTCNIEDMMLKQNAVFLILKKTEFEPIRL